MRMLLIFLALAVAIMVVKRLWLDPHSNARQQGKLTGRMVQCKQCGVYIPEQEAVHSNGQWYCSDTHRDAGNQ